MSRRRRWAAALAAGAGLVLVPAAPALAHPLGNFSVNTADRVVVVSSGVHVTHVVDLAEIPTLQLAQGSTGADADDDGSLSGSEVDGYAGRECARVAGLLELSVDGDRAPLSVRAAAGELRPGQAGLSTARIECRLASDRRPERSVEFADPVGSSRTGWREVTATSVCGRVESSDVPADSPSRLLTAYPEDLLSSPLGTASARLVLAAGGSCLAEEPDAATAVLDRALPRGVDGITEAYTRFVGQVDLTWRVALAAVVLSVVLGAGHALAPGHGKTVVAAYLVGQRGTRRQAVWLGATVTVTHTAGVLLLGLLLTAGRLAAPERVVPLTEVLSGLLLAATGGYLLLRAARRLRAGRGHPASAGHGLGDTPHGHGHGHGHGHDHGHDHGHEPHDHAHPHARPATATALAVRPVQHSHGGRPHSHAVPGDAPLGWKTLAAMGIAGGLVPSPSALVVLLGAAGLGRPAFGALLVVGYGIGMALTLTAAGLFMLRARAVLDRRGWSSGRGAAVARLLPVLTAGAVVSVGLLLVLRGAFSGGVS